MPKLRKHKPLSDREKAQLAAAVALVAAGWLMLIILLSLDIAGVGVYGG